MTFTALCVNHGLQQRDICSQIGITPLDLRRLNDGLAKFASPDLSFVASRIGCSEADLTAKLQWLSAGGAPEAKSMLFERVSPCREALRGGGVEEFNRVASRVFADHEERNQLRIENGDVVWDQFVVEVNARSGRNPFWGRDGYPAERCFEFENPWGGGRIFVGVHERSPMRCHVDPATLRIEARTRINGRRGSWCVDYSCDGTVDVTEVAREAGD